MICAEGHLRMNCHLCPDGEPCLALSPVPVVPPTESPQPVYQRFALGRAASWASAGAATTFLIERLVS